MKKIRPCWFDWVLGRQKKKFYKMFDIREVSRGHVSSLGESNVDGEECESEWCVVKEVSEDKGDELDASLVEDSGVGENLGVDTSVEVVVRDPMEVEPEAVVTAFENLVPL